jgi:hypothetical protein
MEEPTRGKLLNLVVATGDVVTSIVVSALTDNWVRPSLLLRLRRQLGVSPFWDG